MAVVKRGTARGNRRGAHSATRRGAIHALLSSPAWTRHDVRVIEVPEVGPVASARLDGAAVTFRFPDPGYRLAGVRLSQDVRIPGDLLDFHRTAADVSNRTVADVSNGTAADAGDGTAADAGDGWELTVARPPVTRMEYLFELRYPDGGAETASRAA